MVRPDPDAAPPFEPLGVYVHFPWCARKCPYCDFASFEPREGVDRIPHEAYADAVVAELEHRAAILGQRRLATIFFGGGTPSLWKPEALGRVLRAIVNAAPVHEEDIEITVECNPISFDGDKARALADEGVTRLSLGVQGLNAERLQHLGRLHDPDRALRAVEAALASPVPQVSADLMYGVTPQADQAQSPEEAADEADRVAALGVDHLSAYSLTIEPNTRFGELDRRGRLPKAEDEIMAASFDAIGARLAARGLVRYEISNYARPGHESRHNLGYWRGHDYLGLGAAAYGTLSQDPGGAHRYRNAPNPERYLDQAGRLDFEPHEHEPLDGETRLRERIMLGLRLTAGFDLEMAADELGVDPWPEERRRAADRLVERGRLRLEGGRIWIPDGAWMFADGTAAALF